MYWFYYVCNFYFIIIFFLFVDNLSTKNLALIFKCSTFSENIMNIVGALIICSCTGVIDSHVIFLVVFLFIRNNKEKMVKCMMKILFYFFVIQLIIILKKILLNTYINTICINLVYNFQNILVFLRNLKIS